MILGIGCDIVQINRIENLIEKFGDKFINRIYHASEIEAGLKYKNSRKKLHAYYAKRFAAKEAFAKALGSGIGINIAFKDIAILNNDLGKPYIKLDKDILNKITTDFSVKNINIFVSLSDDHPIALAYIIISSD